MEAAFSLTESVVSGDFTSRLETAVRDVIRISKRVDNPADLRTQLTNIMLENPIPLLRDAVISFNDFFTVIVVLIDDLDKGWPPRQVESHDVAMEKHLIEVLNRIRRDLGKRKIKLRHLVLIEVSTMSDPEQLRNLLRQRVMSNLDSTHHEDAWNAINPPMAAGCHGVDLMIESSLQRPRFLIDLCERTLSFAINRGHGFVTEADVKEGLRQMSLYLVSDFGYEMRDITGTPEDIFYSFIGAKNLLTEEDLETILADDVFGLGVSKTIDLLLWYGFLGVIGPSEEQIFIYDRAYDFRRLEAERTDAKDKALYAVNPAFLRGLRRG